MQEKHTLRVKANFSSKAIDEKQITDWLSKIEKRKRPVFYFSKKCPVFYYQIKTTRCTNNLGESSLQEEKNAFAESGNIILAYLLWGVSYFGFACNYIQLVECTKRSSQQK